MKALGKRSKRSSKPVKKEGRGRAFFTLAGMGGGGYLGWWAGGKLAPQFGVQSTAALTGIKLGGAFVGVIVGSIAGGLVGQALLGTKG